jgi:hypothetical protein
MWHAWRGEKRLQGFGRKAKDHLKEQGVDGRMGSKWTLGRLAGVCGVDSPGSCDCDGEPSGSDTTELVRYVLNIIFYPSTFINKILYASRPMQPK